MQRPKVLIVEDESIQAMIIRRIVEGEGYEVAGVVDYAEEVMAAIEKQRPDLVLMDIYLKGGMNGVEAVRAINEKHPLPVIYVTGNTDDETYESAMKTRHVAYMEKPVERAELCARMRSALA